MTICEGKTIERAPLKFCMGCANFEVEKEKKKGKKKEMISNAKLEIFLIHVSHQYVESI
jgi:hypothetical protein